MDQRNPVAVPTLAQEVYARLREQILKGEFSPGEKISIRKLAELYGVSTMPVREALSKLQSQGFVHFERRSIYVNQLTKKELIEVFMIRKNLEKMAVEWSCAHIGKRELEELNRLVEQMDETLDDPIQWNQLNKQFHLQLYSYSQSAPLLELLNTMWGRVEPYMNIYSSLHHLSLSQDEHRQLLHFIAEQQVEKAMELTMHHIQKTCDAILEEFQ